MRRASCREWSAMAARAACGPVQVVTAGGRTHPHLEVVGSLQWDHMASWSVPGDGAQGSSTGWGLVNGIIYRVKPVDWVVVDAGVFCELANNELGADAGLDGGSGKGAR